MADMGGWMEVLVREVWGTKLGLRAVGWRRDFSR